MDIQLVRTKAVQVEKPCQLIESHMYKSSTEQSFFLIPRSLAHNPRGQLRVLEQKSRILHHGFPEESDS